MTEVTESQTTPAEDESAELQLPDEKSLLMQRAKLMGIKFSNNITVEALKTKITAHLEGEKPLVVKTEESPLVPPAIAENTPKPLTKQQYRHKLFQESTKLVRLRITNLDPKKKDLPGEILTVANRVIGTVKKYIPFGEVTENGYHVPYCLYEMLKAKKFLHIRTVGKGDRARIVTSWEREFALEVLEPLTKEQLAELKAAQTARGDLQD